MARTANPLTGLFDQRDPLAGKYYPIGSYAMFANNPVRNIDPTGMVTEEVHSFWDRAMDYLKTWGSSFSSFGENSRGQVYENAHVQNDKVAQANVNKIETVETVASMEVTPYVSVSVGKETAEGNTSFFGGVTLSSDGLYGSIGGDATAGAPGIFTGISISASIGVTIDLSKGSQESVSGVFNSNGGSSSLARGNFEVGGGVGSVVGISSSTKNVRLPVVNNTPTSSYSLGITFTNSPAWVSGNIAYTVPLITWKK